MIFNRAVFKPPNAHDVVSVNEVADSIRDGNGAAEDLKRADKNRLQRL